MPSSGPTGSLRISAVPGPRAERGVRQERGPLVGVVPVDAHHQQDLALGLAGGLAHLPGNQRGQLIDPFGVQLGHSQQDLGPLVLRGGPPGLVGAGRTLQHLLDLRISRGGELTLGLVRGRVDDLELAYCRRCLGLTHADIPPASLPRLLPVPGSVLACFGPVNHDSPGASGGSGRTMTEAAWRRRGGRDSAWRRRGGREPARGRRGGRDPARRRCPCDPWCVTAPWCVSPWKIRVARNIWCIPVHRIFHGARIYHDSGSEVARVFGGWGGTGGCTGRRARRVSGAAGRRVSSGAGGRVSAGSRWWCS